MIEPWPTCTAGNCTGVRVPGSDHCLAHAGETARQATLALIAGGARIDLRGMQLDHSVLTTVLSLLPTGDDERPQWNMVSLDGALIEQNGPLDLTGHRFLGRASMRGLRTMCQLILRDASFDAIDLREAWFEAPVDASDATFAQHARLDEAGFPHGLNLHGAKFLAGVDFRRLEASHVRATKVTVTGNTDLSLAAIDTIDLTRGLLAGDLLLDRARIDSVVLADTVIDGKVRADRAEIRRWEPRFGETTAIAAAADDEVIEEDPAWREDLLHGPAGEYRWLAIEEWVGHEQDPTGAGFRGGIIGLQLAPWPRVDAHGRPVFPPDDPQLIGVDADALATVVAELLGDSYTPLRVGDVYAARLGGTGSLGERPLALDQLREMGWTEFTDITRSARESAQAAAWAVHVPPLDASADALLIQALQEPSP